MKKKRKKKKKAEYKCSSISVPGLSRCEHPVPAATELSDIMPSLL